MKTPIIICALTLSLALLNAQNEEKTSVIRIRKIENVNGVEKIFDTTYRYTGPIYLKGVKGLDNDGEEIKNDKTKKIVIVTDESSDGKNSIELNEKIQKTMEDADIEIQDMNKLITVNIDENTKDGKRNKKSTQIIITKKIEITDANEEDLKLLGNESSVKENKLGLDKMTFYPNPGNGKFNLSFSLPEKKETEVNILNIEGKNIYHENISNFSGNYNKEIDISTNPKGIYFVKISQGKNMQTKKIVLE